MDPADVSHHAGRAPVAAGRALRGSPRRRRRTVAGVRRSHFADAQAGDRHRHRAAHHRCLRDLRPGLRADPRRSRRGHPAALGPRLRQRLQVSADRLCGSAVPDHGPHHPRPRLGSGAHVAAGGRVMSERLLRALVMAVILMIVLLPIYWMVAASLKSNLEITQQATLYPHAPSFDNYRRLFSEKQFGDYFTNSLVVTACWVSLSLVIGTLAAYAIARFHLRFNLERTVGLSLLTLRIVPPVVILIPVYLLMLQLRLL